MSGARLRVLLPLLLASLALAGPASAVATFVPGFVPDWDQPYNYPPPGTGPGPRAAPFTFDAWCVPTSAANLLGHWEDALGRPVSDGAPFPAEGAAQYPVAAAWHDYQADGNRPPPGPAPAATTDLGFYMDTNNLGEVALGNGPHVGTFLKDTHVGIEVLLQRIHGGFRTGTRGRTFAAGTAADGSPATPHPGAGSAFAEIRAEIDAGRTVLITWQHWNVVPPATAVLPVSPVPGATNEALFGAEFFDFGSFTSADPWGNHEEWTEPDSVPEAQVLGHVVTAVGYILANDINDPGYPFSPSAQPSNWVIVHDNVLATPRNLVLPFNALTFPNWVATTNVVFDPPAAIPALGVLGLALLALGIGAAAWRGLRR